jgi:hypothetical protein
MIRYSREIPPLLIMYSDILNHLFSVSILFITCYNKFTITIDTLADL